MRSPRHGVALICVVLLAALLPFAANAADRPTFSTLWSDGQSAKVSINPYPGARSYTVCIRRTTSSRCAQTKTTAGTGPVSFTKLTHAAASAPYDYVVKVAATLSNGSTATSTNRVVNLAERPTFSSISSSAYSATVHVREYSGAESYTVCIRRTTTSNCAKTDEISTAGPVSFSGLSRASASAPYDYVVRVTARLETGGDTTSTNRVVNLRTPVTSGSRPTFASIRTDHQSVTTKLNAYSGAQSYTVCLRRTTSGACDQLKSTSGTGPITFTGLSKAAASAPYDYVVRVTANLSGGRSATSTNRVANLTAPPRPTFASISAGSDRASVTLNSYPGAQSYTVCLRRTTTASCSQTKSSSGTGPITFTGLSKAAASAPYDYVVRVTANFPGGRSETSTNRVVNLSVDPPARPSGISSTVTPSTATITWKAAPGATEYDICVRRKSSDPGCERRSSMISDTTFRFTSLTGVEGPDYVFVVRAFNSGGRTNSPWQKLEMPVAGATAPAIGTATTSSIDLTWEPVWSAVRYRVELSTSSSMSSPVVRYSDQPATKATGLTPGTRYWVRVIGMNDSVKGKASPSVTKSLPSDPARVRVITYNLCGQDKCRSGTSYRVGKWSSRKSSAGRIARGTGAGIISTQESGDKDTNFITELPGFKRARYLSGKSLFYDASLYQAQRSGNITLDSGRKRYAVWVQLMDKKTHTPFVVVDPHLEPYKGKAKDDVRATQTRKLVSEINRINTSDLPVVVAGDFNSNKDNANQSRYPGGYDAVSQVMNVSGFLDAKVTAARAANLTWNSANQAINPPIKHGDHVDHIWTTPDVDVFDWAVIVDLNGSNYRTPWPTDHNPVRATVNIPGLAEGP